MRVTARGIVIDCEVKTKCKIFSVEWTNNTLYMSLNSMAVENKANKEVIESVHEIFKVPKAQISIIAGHKSKIKAVLVENITEDAARHILSQIN
ncbi:hypothetical protein NERG_02222 [Nematocida ausubeli]|uniref:Uncharacterized protein n=1 Tax=Nematocida ausubeli (strain ATCC PRA-371 / ERTm2) TaxID=1913371 RepID=H8ZF53_NEMA1|nr:hypothetical protein NERG_02222 [Nematocida ausubeli]